LWKYLNGEEGRNSDLPGFGLRIERARTCPATAPRDSISRLLLPLRDDASDLAGGNIGSKGFDVPERR
jgi:hypothetical protein